MKSTVPFVLTFLVAIIGIVFIDPGSSSWFSSLHKPNFTPPNAVFLLVWSILYGFMALACVVVWNADGHGKHADGWVRFYFVQLVLNAAWVIFFFGLHALLVAFIDIFFLAFALLMLAIDACEIDPRACYLLLPYVIWVLYATYLNLMIWFLN